MSLLTIVCLTVVLSYSSTMYFEKQTWFRKQNFLFNPEAMVLKTENLMINAKMIIKPQAEVVITVNDLETE